MAARDKNKFTILHARAPDLKTAVFKSGALVMCYFSAYFFND